MKEVKRSQAFLRKRKMLVVLPALVIPFITMAFWSLGGGKGTQIGETNLQLKGLNLQLPDAHLKEEMEDKLSFYEKADKDSLKLEEMMRNDPYYKRSAQDSAYEINELEEMSQELATKHDQLITSPYQPSKDPKIEQKVLSKINDLQQEIGKNEGGKNYSTLRPAVIPKQEDEVFSNQVDRLEQMLGAIQTPPEGDPEMDQVANALDKILDIQHPERVKERLKAQSLQHKNVTYVVTARENPTAIGLLDTAKGIDKSSAFFYGGGTASKELSDDPSISAVVPEGQVLVSGAIIKLRLSNDIFINGVMIPKDNLVFGVATLNNERLQIEITSIRYGQNLFPVKLEVYDLDGLAGIYIPGAISREVAKQSTDNSLQAIEMTTLDPSLKAQAAAAGIGAAKSLISRKVKLIRVMVKEGYKVLLKERQ